MEMLISTHLGLQAVKIWDSGITRIAKGNDERSQGKDRVYWPVHRSYRQLSIVIQQTSIFGYLCAVCRHMSWRHWNLGNSYFLGWWIHTSTWFNLYIRQTLQDTSAKSKSPILPDPTRSYQILPDPTRPTNISWTLQKPVAPTPSTKNNNISWTKIDGRLPGSVNKSKYQKIPTRYGWWIPTWSSGFQIPSGNLLHSYWKWP